MLLFAEDGSFGDSRLHMLSIFVDRSCLYWSVVLENWLVMSGKSDVLCWIVLDRWLMSATMLSIWWNISDE